MSSTPIFVSDLGTSAPPSAVVDVHLPPQRLSDIILHYRDTQLHAHTFVLNHHSAYFRALLDGLQPHSAVVQEVEVMEGGKRRKITTTSEVSDDSSYDATKCHHSPLIHCVHLPDKVGIEEATVETFHLFLRSHYFASTFSFPPFWPKELIVSSVNDETPTCFTFPSSSPTLTAIDEYALKRGDGALILS
jgi:hypothetical protein